LGLQEDWYAISKKATGIRKQDNQSQQQKQQQQQQQQQQMQQEHNKKPLSQKAFRGSTHCATGCTLGDVAAKWLIFLALSILGLTLFASYVIDYIFAYTLGIIFQCLSIVPMRKMMEGKQLSRKEGLKEAIEADTLSLTAYEVGLFIWMGLTQLVFFHPKLELTEPTFWFMMQVGMALGLLTTYPANWWLVRKGIKYGM
jgi:hypothetical protein